MPLELDFHVIPDPQGFAPALLLHGDWVFVTLSDGRHTGIGEATHSGDDQRCMKTISDLFDRRIRRMPVDLNAIREFEDEVLSTKPDFLTATALSALNQALYDLLARRRGVPVWRLLVEEPVRRQLPLYVTINRALTTRTHDDYRDVVYQVVERGFRHVKCAPFERVHPDSDPLESSKPGLAVLSMLTAEFPHVTFRVDCHKRFTPEVFMQLLPEFNRLGLFWIEEPFELGEAYVELRQQAGPKVAAGELFFGPEPFREMITRLWTDVIMPDVKHVGGFGPLLKVCAAAAEQEVEVSPHNPSGPVSTAASSHGAAVYPGVTSLEIPFDRDRRRDVWHEHIDGGVIHITDEPGWGIDLPKNAP